MKKINVFLFAVLALLLTACSGSGLKPVSEKIQGPLSEYFEVVTRDYKVKDGKVSIEIKRIKDGFPGPWEKGMEVGYGDGTITPLFSVEFQDGDGNAVGKDAADIIYDIEELKAIAALNTDESASITFDCPKDAKQFKVNSTFKVNGKNDSDQAGAFSTNLSGKIGAYAIQMTLNVEADGEVTGAYYYKKKGPGALLYVKGTKRGNKITLSEFTKDGEQTGTYRGTYSGGVYKGHFSTNSGEYSFLLTEDETMETLDLSAMDFDSFAAALSDEYTEDDESTYQSAGSEDWDDLLQSYEQYVNKYIAYLKKATKGDATALAEYPGLMKKAQEFAEKLDAARDEMSASQLARYTKINMKMLKAAEEMSRH